MVVRPRSARNPARWLLGCAAVTATIACSTGFSQVPLANSDPEGSDTYYYGSAAKGGKSLPAEDSSSSADEAVAEEKTPVPQADTSSTTKTAKAKASSAAPEKKPEKDEAPRFAQLVGTYLGTDTVTIRFEGLPEQVEQDEAAKMAVDAEQPGTFTFRIVDSQSGDDLCAVKGEAQEDKIHFAPGQSCLHEILGTPMTATLTDGSATLNGAALEVDLQIDVEATSPLGSLEGTISYHFEGERE